MVQIKHNQIVKQEVWHNVDIMINDVEISLNIIGVNSRMTRQYELDYEILNIPLRKLTDDEEDEIYEFVHSGEWRK